MPRNLSGEQAIVATTLHLRKDTYTAGGVSTSLQNIYDLFMLLERLKTTGSLDESSADPCSQQLIGVFVRAPFDLCRLKSVHVPVGEISGLAAFMQAYRFITNNQYSSIQLLDTVFVDRRNWEDKFELTPIFQGDQKLWHPLSWFC